MNSKVLCDGRDINVKSFNVDYEFTKKLRGVILSGPVIRTKTMNGWFLGIEEWMVRLFLSMLKPPISCSLNRAGIMEILYGSWG